MLNRSSVAFVEYVCLKGLCVRLLRTQHTMDVPTPKATTIGLPKGSVGDLNDLQLRAFKKVVNERHNIFLTGAGGVGKCLDPETPVLMHNGSTLAIKNIVCGDLVMGDDSTPRTVLSTTGGKDQMYKIEMACNGLRPSSFVCNSHHILTLRTRSEPSITIDISITRYLAKSPEWKANYCACQPNVVIFPKCEELELDPYFFGVWMMRGVIDYEGGIEDYTVSSPIVDLELLENGHLPLKYRCGTPQTRRSLLEGVFSVAIHRKSSVEAHSSQVAEDIVFIAKSLGYAFDGVDFAQIFKNKNPEYRLTATSIGRGEYRGFTLDGNARFVLGNFIITHNSFSIGVIVRELERQGRQVAVTAMTGTAANLINGRTMHSWAGISLGTATSEELVKKLLHNPRSARALANWRRTNVLFIDEISMLKVSLFDKLDYIGRKLRRSPNKPFGGMQLVLCGDFAQLPPVTKRGEIGGGFCFKSKMWSTVIRPDDEVELTEVIRQSEGPFRDALGEIRMGLVTPKTAALLHARVGASVGKDGIEPTKLFSYRRDVARINNQRLQNLPGKTHEYIARDSYSPHNPSKKAMSVIEKRIEKLQAPMSLKLKKGAQVMLIYNTPNGDLINGSRGVVLGFTREGLPAVHFLNGIQCAVARHDWKMKIDDKIWFTRSQIPLILAWASTTHKIQGATLTCAEMDIGNSFAPGQAYVALSRVSSLEGLSLSNRNLLGIRASKEVVEFYKRLQERQTLATLCTTPPSMTELALCATVPPNATPKTTPKSTPKATNGKRARTKSMKATKATKATKTTKATKATKSTKRTKQKKLSSAASSAGFSIKPKYNK